MKPLLLLVLAERGFVHETGGAAHTYRIAIGPSRCGFIYANI